MDSFWGTLKNEPARHRRDAARAGAQASIQAYIEISITESGAISASDSFRQRCSLKNSANNRRRLEASVAAFGTTPHPGT